MFRLRVLCVGDVYSETPIRGRGGYAELAHVVANLRQGHENVLLLGLGDLLGGSNLCEITHGKHVVELLNALKFDACAVGNHEFDHAPGEATLEERVAESNFPWLAANVFKKKAPASLFTPDVTPSALLEPLHGVLPHVVRSFVTAQGKTVRIGLLGLCTVHTPSLSYPSAAVHFESVVEAAQRSVATLRDELQCDLVIGLTHQTFYEDKQLVKLVRGIDLVLGGHDHDAIAAVVAEPSRLGDTLIFKPGMNAYWCGVIDVQLLLDQAAPGHEAQSGFFSYRNEAVALVDTKTPCAEAAACREIIARYEAQRLLAEAAAAETVLVHALPAPLNMQTKAVRSRECSGGSLLADAMRAWTAGTEIGLINGGFIRNDKLYPVGATITQADVLDMLPFSRPINLIDISGADLQRGLEQMLAQTPAATGGFPHVSRGVVIEYAPEAPAMAKIRSFSLNGEPLIAERLYRVATSKFLVSGGDGCTAFTKNTPIESHEVRIAKTLIRFLEVHGDNVAIPADQEGRIIAVN